MDRLFADERLTVAARAAISECANMPLHPAVTEACARIQNAPTVMSFEKDQQQGA